MEALRVRSFPVSALNKSLSLSVPVDSRGRQPASLWGCSPPPALSQPNSLIPEALTSCQSPQGHAEPGLHLLHEYFAPSPSPDVLESCLPSSPWGCSLSPPPPRQKAPGPSPCPQAPVAGACSALESPPDPQHPAIPHFLPSMQQEVVLTPKGITLRGLSHSEAWLEGSPGKRAHARTRAHTHTHTASGGLQKLSSPPETESEFQKLRTVREGSQRGQALALGPELWFLERPQPGAWREAEGGGGRKC